MADSSERRVHGVVKALYGKTGGTLPSSDDKFDLIERYGQGHSAETLRLALIGGLQLRPRDWPDTADNLIHIGCLCWGTTFAIMAYCKLLQRLDERYVFLRKEYCCAAGLLIRAGLEGDASDLAKAEEASSYFIGKNITTTVKMGAKRIFYCCPWCAYLGRRFHPEPEVPHTYYMDHVADVLNRRKPALRLEGRVAYFQGGQHRRTFYVPGIKWDFDWPSYRRILDSIEGLTVIDMPKYCCVTHPEAINRVLEREQITTLVTPCMTCYGRMMRKVPKGVRVVTIPELVLDALGEGTAM